MTSEMTFFLVTLAVSMLLPPLAGAGTVAVCHLAGMRSAALVVAFGSAATATFGAVVSVSVLAAALFFG
jgi:hypothetical protein